MQIAVRPKPVEAMLAATVVSFVRTLQRSFVSPVFGFACSQKKRKFACSKSLRNWSSCGESAVGEGEGAGLVCCSGACCSGSCCPLGPFPRRGSIPAREIGSPKDRPAIPRSNLRRDSATVALFRMCMLLSLTDRSTGGANTRAAARKGPERTSAATDYRCNCILTVRDGRSATKFRGVKLHPGG